MRIRKLGLALFLFPSLIIGCNGENDSGIAPTSITINGDIAVAINSSSQYSASFEPSDASKAVKWSVDDERYATIDDNGKLTTNSYIGIITITATSKIDHSKYANYSIYITKSIDKANFFKEYYIRYNKAQELGKNYYKSVKLNSSDTYEGHELSYYNRYYLEYDKDEGEISATLWFELKDKNDAVGIGLITDIYSLHITTIVSEEIYDKIEYKTYEDNSIGMEFYFNEGGQLELNNKFVYDENGYLIEYYVKYDDDELFNEESTTSNLHIQYIKEEIK